MTSGSYECTVNGETENGQERKNRKGHRRAKISEWGGEKSNWQWRMEAVKDIYWAICYYRSRETNNFFLFLQPYEDAHQFSGPWFLDFVFSPSVVGWWRCVPQTSGSFITKRKKKKRDIPPGASWVILRGRKRGDGERMAAGLFVIYCSLSPFAPRHPHNLWGQSPGPPRSIGAVPDGCTMGPGGRRGESGRQRMRSDCLTVFITVN